MLGELARQNEGRKGRTWHYDYHDEEHDDARPSCIRSVANQSIVLDALEREGAIKLLKTEKRYGFLPTESGPALWKVPGTVTLEVLNPTFEQLYSKYVGKRFGRPIEKVEVIFSKKRGIFRADGAGTVYGMKDVSKRRAIIELLLRERKASADDIYGVTEWEVSTISNEIKEINRLVVEHTEVRHPFIENSGGGYYINDRAFDVREEG